MQIRRTPTKEMAARDVHVVSRRMVRPTPRANGEGCRTIHLNPLDLRMLSVDYIQKGILFAKPQQQERQEAIISRLFSSFAVALDHFYPLAGRLATVKHDTAPPSLSICLDYNDEGAEFIHAAAASVTVSDLMTPFYIPSIVHSFFPLNGVIGVDGHSFPLLAVQVTELGDGGVFIACSLNHAVADGTSFWHFINSWSEISRTGLHSIPHPPVLDRWFLDSCSPPIHLPFADTQEFIIRPIYKPVKECYFHFSAQSIAKLKARANKEMDTNRISSLQSLLGLVWRSVTRARRLENQQETIYVVLVGSRTRVAPQLPQEYLGNAVVWSPAKATAGEIMQRGLGWAAWLLNQAVASQSEAAVRDAFEKWAASPSFACPNHFRPSDIGTGSSPRFDVYGNDFGWGRPVAVRSGEGNKTDGKVTVYPGPKQDGSIALEVCLSATALSALVEDDEFLDAVSNA